MKQEQTKTVFVSVHRHVHAPVNIQDQKTPKVGKDAYFIYMSIISTVCDTVYFTVIYIPLNNASGTKCASLLCSLNCDSLIPVHFCLLFMCDIHIFLQFSFFCLSTGLNQTTQYMHIFHAKPFSSFFQTIYKWYGTKFDLIFQLVKNLFWGKCIAVHFFFTVQQLPCLAVLVVWAVPVVWAGLLPVQST